MTRRLIEAWLPIAALGIESLRERTPMTPFPAPNRPHPMDSKNWDACLTTRSCYRQALKRGV